MASGGDSGSGSRELSDRVEIGYVAKAHGVRGELKIVLHNPESDALDRTDTLYLGDVEAQIESARYVGGGVLITVDVCADRNAAEAQKGKPVNVARTDLGLAEDEVLLADLVGCAVVTRAGEPYGTIADVVHGPQDCLRIVDGQVERLLPLVDEFVLDIDVAAGRVVVDPPEGLPEEPVR